MAEQPPSKPTLVPRAASPAAPRVSLSSYQPDRALVRRALGLPESPAAKERPRG